MVGDGAVGVRQGRGPRRIGVLGGSFDPPHVGHLIVAQEAVECLHLERVLFVPAGVQPFKQGEPVSPAEQRVRMTELAIGGDARFALSRADVDRPGPSYTADLLQILHRELGPGVELDFIVGADALGNLVRWRDPARILAQCRLIGVPRPGYPLGEPPELVPLLARTGSRLILLDTPGVDISSTEIRERVRVGRAIRYLVPPGVEAYIGEEGLYSERWWAAGAAAR